MCPGSNSARWQQQSCSSLASLAWRHPSYWLFSFLPQQQISPAETRCVLPQAASPTSASCPPSTFRPCLTGGAVRACALAWRFTPTGLPRHRLQRTLCEMWTSPSAVSSLWKLRITASSVHATPAKKQAASEETNQPFKERQSLPAQLGVKGRQRFVAVLFCFKLNCLGHPYPFQFLVSSEKQRKLNYMSRRWFLITTTFSPRDQKHMLELMDSFH